MRRLQYSEAERALVCAVMLGGDAVLDRMLVEPEEFYDPRSREVFSAMRALRARGNPPGDVKLLEVEIGPRMQAIGGLGFFAELVSDTHASLDHVEHYESLVRKAALTRRTITTLSELQTSDLEGTELVARVLEQTSLLARLTDDPAVTIGEAVKEAFSMLAEARKSGRTWGLTTGFDDLDKAIGGLQYSVLTILAGRPSMGKSALARSIAANANLKADAGIHVFTPEDSRRTYAMRQMSDESRVTLENLRSLRISDTEFQQVQRAAGDLWRRRNWLIDDTAGLSSTDIAMRVRKHKRDNNTKLVVVDYAQLIREPGVALGDKRMQVEIAAENLAQLARSEGVALLLLSQLSRECEKREDKRPMLSDLRESGALEQLAEAVIFVYRDEYYNPDSSAAGMSEAIVRKNKNGACCTVKLKWDANTATHRPYSAPYRAQEEMYQ